MAFDWGRMADATQGALSKAANRYRQRADENREDQRYAQRFMFETAINETMARRNQDRQLSMQKTLSKYDQKIHQENSIHQASLTAEVNMWGGTSGDDEYNEMMASPDERIQAQGQALGAALEALHGGQALSEEEMEQAASLTQNMQTRTHMQSLNRINEDRDMKTQKDEQSMEQQKYYMDYLAAMTSQVEATAAKLEAGEKLTTDDFLKSSRAMSASWAQVMQGEPYRKYAAAVEAGRWFNPETRELEFDQGRLNHEQVIAFNEFRPIMEEFELQREILHKLYGLDKPDFDRWLYMMGYPGLGEEDKQLEDEEYERRDTGLDGLFKWDDPKYDKLRK